MHNAMLKDSRTNKERSDQIKTGMWLDSVFYFNDLWGFLHYAIKQTVYDPALGPWNWGPLRPITDYDYEIDEDKIRSLKHYPSSDTAHFASEFNIARSYTSAYFKTVSEGKVLDEEAFDNASDIIIKHPLIDMAEHIIVMSIPESPYYTDQMSEQEQADYMLVRLRKVKTWKDNGFHSFFLHGLEAEDYGDRSHLNTLGGWKLAKAVSENIRRLTHK
jgi:hypothetical protein